MLKLLALTTKHETGSDRYASLLSCKIGLMLLKMFHIYVLNLLTLYGKLDRLMVVRVFFCNIITI